MSDNSFGTTFGPSTPGRAEPGFRPDPRRDRRRPGRAARTRHASSATPTRPSTTAPARGTVYHDRTERRRPAERQAHQLGLVPGRLPPHRRTSNGKAVCGSSTRNIGGGQQCRLHPPPRALPVLRLDRQPAPSAAGVSRQRSATTARPTTSTTSVRLRRRPASGTVCRRSASSRPPATRTATPATPTRWTSRTSWSTPSTSCSTATTGSPPPSSSPMTTPTAGTTTRCRPIVNSSQIHRRRPVRSRPVRHQQARRRLPGPLRLRPPAAAAGHLALRRVNFVDHTHHRPELDPALHRRQLAHRPHRRQLLRRVGRQSQPHVRLPARRSRQADPRPGNRAAHERLTGRTSRTAVAGVGLPGAQAFG